MGGGGEGGLGSEGEREAWWRRGRGRPPSGSSPLLRLALLPFSAWLFSPPLEPVGACREERERETALGKSSMGGPSGSAAPPPWGSTRRRFLQVAVFMAAPWWEGREREARWEGREREAALGSSPPPSLGSSPLPTLGSSPLLPGTLGLITGATAGADAGGTLTPGGGTHDPEAWGWGGAAPPPPCRLLPL